MWNLSAGFLLTELGSKGFEMSQVRSIRGVGIVFAMPMGVPVLVVGRA
jgi:hypothetical protein